MSSSPFRFAPPGGRPGAASPQQVDALFAQAHALHQAGQVAQALALYERVIAAQPRHVDALHLAGVIHLAQGQAQQAVDLITRAIKAAPRNASAYKNRGAACAALGQFDLALLNCAKAIELQPDMEAAHSNRANVLMQLERNDEALADLERAVALDANSHAAHNNLGNVLSRLGRYAEAIEAYRHAVALQPDAPAARWNLGLCLLRLGHFAEGWSHAEARLAQWASRGWAPPTDAPPLRLDAPLAGQTVLAFHEQGLGDTLQFARYLPLLQARGAQVVLQAQPELCTLLREALPSVQVVASGEPLPAHDVGVPLLSLPGLFATDLDHIPPALPLHAPAERTGAWQARLNALLGAPAPASASARTRVGIAWSGNARHVDDAQRSLPLSALAPLLSEDCDWLSLHKEVRDTDLAALHGLPQLHTVGEALHDFGDTAALCAHLDLVISADTSVAHLAASLGRPVWLLLPFTPDWRWLTERTDSPWYPGMRLYRQTTRGDWAEVLARVQADLHAWRA